jgi:hypothetical protein
MMAGWTAYPGIAVEEDHAPCGWRPKKAVCVDSATNFRVSGKDVMPKKYKIRVSKM